MHRWKFQFSLFHIFLFFRLSNFRDKRVNDLFIYFTYFYQNSSCKNTGIEEATREPSKQTIKILALLSNNNPQFLQIA